jgi:hypothetical protein
MALHQLLPMLRCAVTGLEIFVTIYLVLGLGPVQCFVPIVPHQQATILRHNNNEQISSPIYNSVTWILKDATSTVLRSTIESQSDTNQEIPTLFERIDRTKSRLIQLCESKPLLNQIRDAMSELESLANEQRENDDTYNPYQIYDWMNGEWELVYSPVDMTRSSPFFWAFRSAFPTQSDQIYSITDAIPSPIKEVGPAYQEIDCRATTTSTSSSYSNYLESTPVSGTFVSRVKVATLGGAATSMMTTRASIIGSDGNDGIRLKIETTKPEQSTIVTTLFGPNFGQMINDAIPAFPSGDTLEQIVPGSSEVIVRTTFCDATLRITKNNNRMIDEFFIWKRKSFATYEML